jgi:membrane protease YdiL (CAAX protease family)
VVFIGLATFAVIQVIAAVFATNATGTVVLQALAAEIGAGRAGVTWSRWREPPPLRRALTGAALGFGFAGVLLLAGVASGSLTLEVGSNPSLVSLLLGAALAAATAVRDELLLRGIVVSTLRDRVPRAGLFAAAGLASVAAASPTSVPDAVTAIALGVAYAGLWTIEGGAFMAVAAHASIAFATGALLAGPLELRNLGRLFSTPGTGPAGNAGILSSPAAAGLAVLAASAVAWKATRPRKSR